jgi:hypothetical protein
MPALREEENDRMTLHAIKDNRSEAEARADKIRAGLYALVDWRETFVEAWANRDDLQLGYAEDNRPSVKSWAAYLVAEFDMLPRLDRPVRDALIVALHEAKMPSRYIALTIGAAKSTVGNVLASSGQAQEEEEHVTQPQPEPEPEQPKPARKPRLRKGERPGATQWSRAVQRVTARVPMDDLTDDQVDELEGAADYLKVYCLSELKIRSER